MRRLLWLVVPLLLLAGLVVALLVADRSAAAYAERAVEAEVRRAAGSPDGVRVRVVGRPFLTQALRGRYDRVEVRLTGLEAAGVRLGQVDAVLLGAQVPLADALSRQVREVPVDRLDTRVRVPYDALSRSSGGRRLTVSPAGEDVRVSGEVEVFGRRLTASAVSTVELRGDAVVVTARSFETGDATADDLLTDVLRDRFDLRLPLPALPYGLVVQDLDVEPDGVVVRSVADGPVLARR